MTLALAAIAALLISLVAAVRPGTVSAFTAGDNGHPTNGPYSDLKGGSGTFTFQTDGQLFCDSNDTASGFKFHLDYSNASLPAGASLVIYLSPNQGAINNNANGNASAYIAAVESNYGVINFPSGLSGSGTLTINLSVTTPFQATGGGILGVVATESDGTIVTNSKTNSLNCTEAASTPTPTPTPEGSVQAATPTPSPTPEGSVEAATPAPSASTPNTAFSAPASTSGGTLLAGLLLVVSLMTLAAVNVRTARRRR